MNDRLPRVFVALDFSNPIAALGLVDRLDPGLCGLKVGKELFVSAGPEPVRWMVERGFAVFLDLKFHDIPNTCASACAAATRLGVAMLNVHASGGRAMLAAARAAVDATARDAGKERPLLIGVTVLTSLGDRDLVDVGVATGAAPQVQQLAKLTKESGLDGVVCSAQEARILRATCGPDFTLVTPGIRPADGSTDDQVRVVTPEQAVRDGADHLVIGRPITEAADPASAAGAIGAALASSARS